MLYQTGGTILAANLALKYGWSINLVRKSLILISLRTLFQGGGFHHACGYNGSGFCVYADITIAIKNLREKNSELKVLIIDLDAHQGNGHERDFIGDENTFIFDIYNHQIFPGDKTALQGVYKKIFFSKFP
jgi:histone deacetylase 11